MSFARNTWLFRAGLVSISCIGAPAVAGESGGWDWTVAPYLWMTSLDASVNAGGREIDVDMSFSDALDDLDFAFQIHFEGARDEYGFFADGTWLDLSAKSTSGPVTEKSSTSVNLYELAGVYRPSASDEGFHAFAGLRYMKVDQDSSVTGLPVPPGDISISLDKSFADFMVGARYIGVINENWYYTLRADASGGESDGTWSVSALANYRFGQEKDKGLIFGYRHMEIDVSDERIRTDVEVDLTMSGPFVAVSFDF